MNEKKDDGFTPLHLACLNNHYETAKLLIENGCANLDPKNVNKQTPLHLAVERLNGHLIKLLVQKKCNVNMEDRDGDTPLHCVVRHYTLSRIKNAMTFDDQSKVTLNALENI